MVGNRRPLPSERGPSWDTGGVLMPGDRPVASVFDRDPIRRSAAFALLLAALLAGCAWVAAHDHGLAPVVMIVAAGFAALLIFTTLLLLWCVVEEVRRQVRRRISPDLSVLDLPARTENILRRAGYETLADVTPLDDDSLLSLRRMEDHDLRAIRRALALHEYREWQARGFPDR
jgi:hypothetical protein